MLESSMDNNTLISSLAGDATTVGGTFIATNAAEQALKANPNSATTLILMVGAVAVVFIFVILKKK